LSLLSWIGGKSRLRKSISEIIPKKINCYIEPFGGGAWVLFFKNRWGSTEVYNDLNGDLVNLFRIVKYHPEALSKEFEFMVSSRELFYQLLNSPGITEVQRAARFLYLIKRSFGSKGESFGTSRKSGGAGFASHINMMELMKKVHARLDRTILENLSYEKIFEKYDGPANFFYLDPPYFKGDKYYGFGSFDHSAFAGHLKDLSARWLLSIDDCERSRELFSGYNITPISRQQGINMKNPKSTVFKELLIRNY
ncbi:DNA adenine methylase, partial [bacterium]|nr:DNA adenine methylase [bacterium]